METEAQRKLVQDRIKQNIEKYGYHIYAVLAGEYPRFVYTIGLRASVGFELILAGAGFYMAEEVTKIMNEIAGRLKFQKVLTTSEFEVVGCGSFSLRKIHASWTTALMLGAIDFYQQRNVPAFQIVPDSEHWTIDIPNMSEAWNATTAPVWRWLHEPWTYPVPSKSVAGTNLAALRGERITEAMRWEEDEWELFAGAGPEVPNAEMRVAPLGTILAWDSSLEPVLDLRVGEGLWRDGDSGWHAWMAKRNELG